MKKIMVSISLALILGLLVVIPGSTQMKTSSEEVGLSDTMSLRLLITINRLELSPTQMQEIHDILAGVLSEADALKTDRDAFAQEMLRFNGSGEELEAMIEAYKDQMKDKAASLQESAQGALDEIKGILTVKQGEILRDSFMPMHDRMWGGKAGLTGMRDRGRTQGEQLTPQGRGRMGQQFRTQFKDEASGPIADRIREFIDMHPEMREQMAQRFRAEGGQERAFGSSDERPLEIGGQFGVDHPLLAQRLANKRLATLQQIVDILETKLQYIQ
ncbi:TPA: hypothetical protein DIT45_00550 [Candidatus Acetothermia bacterium]|nr:hypothetical protein [Candidatus Acetothermia bacterium]